MIFKTINDFVDSNDFVSILLVFEAYSRMTESNASSLIITQRATTMKRIMKEVRKCNAFRQINDALNTRNDLSIDFVHDVSINSSVLMFREENTDQSDA